MTTENNTSNTNTTNDQDDVFNQSTTNTSTSNLDNQDPVFNSLVGEGKRYSNADELAKGKMEGDSFIEQLKGENAEMRKALETATTLDSVLNSINNDTQSNQDGQAHPQDTSKNLELDAEALGKLIDSHINNTTAKNTSQSNLDSVIDTLIKREGDATKANQFIQSMANRLSSSADVLKTMAQDNPTMFYQLAGIDNSGTTQNKGVPGDGSSINTETLAARNASQTKEGTFRFYQDLRKADPNRYYSPKIQNEMFRKRKEMGEAFYK